MPEEAAELIKMIANNQYLYSSDMNLVNSRAPQKKGVLEVDTLDAILPQNKVMSQQINMLTQHLSGMQETRASLKNLEVQMGQISTKVAKIDQRTTNSLPGNTIPNLREECKSINLISGQVASMEAQVIEEPVEKRAPKEKKEEVEHTPPRRADNPFPVLDQMLLYVKFMKELLSKKKPLKGDEIVVLTKECSAIIQNNLPRKMLDLGSFQIPFTIGSTTSEKTLCDLGGRINLIPLSVMKKLQIKEEQPTRIALQMADKSLKHAHGIVENVLVKVGKFFLLVDFVILDMREDENASIILGRPFLAIGRALIDVEQGELVLSVHNEQLVFHVFKKMHSSGEEEKCMQTELIDPNLQEPLDDAQQNL
ncbi:uncharacterized protein LOC130933985 [Arachis stenosperma]|uniref:uncharacterized protein LOC130933985 n=1 Tax=Arachis stenosperma TaxID=217475 RepID=UPI0025ACFB31|nr:uncharacterized protein LOC130933985 [Arachis stenosperma]